VRTRDRSVSIAMRPGSQPSQNSAAIRADFGVAPAVPQRRRTAGRARPHGHVLERERRGVPRDVVLAPEPPQKLDVVLHQMRAWHAGQADSGELVVEVAGPHAQDQAWAEELRHRADHHRQVQRMAERNERAGAQLKLGR
jgi:hypothetical protein